MGPGSWRPALKRMHLLCCLKHMHLLCCYGRGRWIEEVTAVQNLRPMKNWIDQEIFCTNIVAPYFHCSRCSNSEFLQKRLYPHNFCCSIC
jgi:hypothetical protein